MPPLPAVPPVPPIAPPVPASREPASGSGSRGVNFHQLNLNRSPLPPVNFRNRSCFPVAPLTVQDWVAQVCAPPVPEIAQVPTSVPVALSRRSSMLPPLDAAATLAAKDTAPVPKSTEPTLM